MISVTPRLLIEWFLKDFHKIILFFIFFSIVAVFYSLSIPNKYLSTTIVASNMSDSKSVGGALSKLGGLASLAGISLGGGDMSPEVLKEMLKSKSFLSSFIKKYQLEVDIMVANGFNPEKNQLLYKDKVFDFVQNKWIREVDFPKEKIPSEIELVKKFNEYYSVSYDRKTKLITMSFKFFSPEYSKGLLVNLVSFFNEYMRENDISDSESSIEYLKKQLDETKYHEIKLALQQIIEEQYKKLALAKTRKEYAVRVIEQPMRAFEKSEPNRVILCLAISFLGTFLSILFMWSIRIIRN
jgi:hypothetical protein